MLHGQHFVSIYDTYNKLKTSGICAKANLISVFIAEII